MGEFFDKHYHTKICSLVLSCLVLMCCLIGCSSNQSDIVETSESNTATADNASSLSEQDNINISEVTDTDTDTTSSKTEQESDSDIELSEYAINGIDYSVPSTWKIKSETERLTTFQIDNDEYNIAVVKSEVIPDIMKIDVGANSVTSKEGTVNYAIGSGRDNILKEEWITTNNFEYYDTTYHYNGKLNNGEQDNRTYRTVVIPINETEAYFAVTILSNNENDLYIIDNIISDLTLPTNTKHDTISTEEQIYNDAISATKADLTGTKGSWYFKEIPLLSDDCDWIDNPLNKNGSVNQGAIYRKIAVVLSGSNFETKQFLYDYKDISDLLLGFTPTTKDDYIPYAKNASEFIVTENQIHAIMKKFESMKSVSGEYDFDYGKLGKYNVKINDLTECAAEMQISEEMLGYVLAELTEYGVTITFDGNSCTIEYTSYS